MVVEVEAVMEVALALREREISRLSRLYAALSHINQAIVATPTRDELFQEICRALCEHGGFRMSWIGWHLPDTEQIVPIAAAGDDQGYLRSVMIYADEARPEGRGPSGIAFREGRPYISNHLLDDPASLPWRDEIIRRGFAASAVFPIREAGQVCGTLSVYAEEIDYFQGREIGLLASAASDVSFALDSLGREQARRRAEVVLRQERDFSAAVLDALPGILYLYDQCGRFLRWNRNFEQVSGYTAAEIATMHPLQFFDGDRELVAARIEEVFERGDSSVEAGLVSKDGRVTPFYFTGVKTVVGGQPCLVGVGIDASERARAEAARQASDARYRTLFEYAPDGIVVADARSYYLDANASMCRMLGYSRDELIGKHAADIVVQAEVPQISAALREIQSAGDYQREWEFRRKDGSTFPADVIATPMPDGNILAMVRDISTRKQAERALHELNESLERKVTERTGELQTALVRAEAADHLKSAFLATMSHELRTPLNSIIGFTGILLQLMAGPLTPEQTKQLGMVRGSARHLLELINDVLDLSKIEADQLEIHAASFELRRSLEHVISTVTPLAEARSLTLAMTIDPAIGALVSDRRRVEQILLNVLNNAIKFTERGGVMITAEHVTTPPSVRLRIVDTGVGISAEDLPKLFQPFRQLDTGLTRRHEGTGLGLAICRRLATLLGGEITVTSAPGRGSEFTVTLPLIPASAP